MYVIFFRTLSFNFFFRGIRINLFKLQVKLFEQLIFKDTGTHTDLKVTTIVLHQD